MTAQKIIEILDQWEGYRVNTVGLAECKLKFPILFAGTGSEQAAMQIFSDSDCNGV